MKSQKISVASLRKSGHKVRVQHHRRFIWPMRHRYFLESSFIDRVSPKEFSTGRAKTVEIPYKISATGGKTVVSVETKSGKTFQAESLVNDHDFYNRPRGLRICLGRILAQAEAAGETLS